MLNAAEIILKCKSNPEKYFKVWPLTILFCSSHIKILQVTRTLLALFSLGLCTWFLLARTLICFFPLPLLRQLSFTAVIDTLETVHDAPASIRSALKGCDGTLYLSPLTMGNNLRSSICLLLVQTTTSLRDQPVFFCSPLCS
jgi:hypothetical protein